APHTIKWILTGGEPETLHHQLQARMYFDQQGNLSRALTLKRVPSVVKQAGVMWQVTEIDVSHFPVFMEETHHVAN
ncbi:MAG: type-F conjugative transfer system protein TraW, partial [Shewanella sp.]